MTKSTKHKGNHLDPVLLEETCDFLKKPIIHEREVVHLIQERPPSSLLVLAEVFQM